MIILRMAGKILLLSVWLLLATAHLLVKIAVEIYCIGKGLINLILGFMLIGTLLWYRQWERFALLAEVTASRLEFADGKDASGNTPIPFPEADADGFQHIPDGYGEELPFR